MSKSTVDHPLVVGYLDRLEHAAAALPAHRRAELLEEIRAHVELSLPGTPSEADVRTLLDRVGDPTEIVAAEWDATPPTAPGSGVTAPGSTGLPGIAPGAAEEYAAVPGSGGEHAAAPGSPEGRAVASGLSGERAGVPGSPEGRAVASDPGGEHSVGPGSARERAGASGPDGERAAASRHVERESLRRKDIVGLLLLLAGGAVVPPVGYLLGTALVGFSRRWAVPARVVLVGLPCAAALRVVAEWVRDGHWYSVADLVVDPRGALHDFANLGALALPYTSVQVALLLLVRYVGRGR
ncbi:hypothetical protein [Actinosynnema sp. NPDC020468]|uniref:HAAS signaling domain-containing protein n=1 Tax=Actinosynnema sp. NPDC020468 TaxID=3154488 RepID=UPI00340F6ED2